MSGKPKPCRFPGCGLVFTPGYYAEHAAAYHEGGRQRKVADCHPDCGPIVDRQGATHCHRNADGDCWHEEVVA